MSDEKKTGSEENQNNSPSENKVDNKEQVVKSTPKNKQSSKKTVLKNEQVTSQKKVSSKKKLDLKKRKIFPNLRGFFLLSTIFILSCIWIDLLFQPNIASLNILGLIKNITPSIFTVDIIFGVIVGVLGIIYWLCLVAIKLFFYFLIYLISSGILGDIAKVIIALYKKNFSSYWEETCKWYKDFFTEDETDYEKIKKRYKSKTKVEKSQLKVLFFIFLVIPILYSIIVGYQTIKRQAKACLFKTLKFLRRNLLLTYFKKYIKYTLDAIFRIQISLKFFVNLQFV